MTTPFDARAEMLRLFRLPFVDRAQATIESLKAAYRAGLAAQAAPPVEPVSESPAPCSRAANLPVTKT